MDKTEEILFGEKIRACFKDVLNISDDLIITFREELDRESQEKVEDIVKKVMASPYLDLKMNWEKKERISLVVKVTPSSMFFPVIASRVALQVIMNPAASNDFGSVNRNFAWKWGAVRTRIRPAKVSRSLLCSLITPFSNSVIFVQSMFVLPYRMFHSKYSSYSIS